MALYYAAGFSSADLGGLSVVVGGVASGTATVTPGTYCHISLSAVTGGITYRGLAGRVDSALAAVDAGFECVYNASTYQYTITNPSAFTLTWSGDSGAALRRALGFSGNVSSTMSATSDVRPYYLMVPQIAGRSQYTDTYEPDDIAEEAVADGGDAYIVSRDTDELWCDWVQSMETKEATLARSATAAVPWTWQDFFKHCRGEHPFLVVDGSDLIVYRLRADGASFNSRVRERVAVDYDDLWNLRFFTRDMGVLP